MKPIEDYIDEFGMTFVRIWFGFIMLIALAFVPAITVLIYYEFGPYGLIILPVLFISYIIGKKALP